jgi:hypothetical protein
MAHTKKLWLAMCLGGLALAACSTRSDGAGSSAAAASTDPLEMPAAIVSYEVAGKWGTHHLEWHTERQWDLLDKSDLAWAQKQGWKRADIQEGAPGNGFEFLVMHRAMLTILRGKFPSNVDLFSGWTAPPTSATKADPLPSGTAAFDPEMLKALDTIANHIDTFTTDDAFGLYVETNLRPVAGNPQATSTDPTVGLHNFIHNRFSDPSSPIDMGDPSKNLANKIFWQLHGWIDARWSAVRAENNLSDSDPAFQAALKNAEDMYTEGMNMGLTEGATDDAPPSSLTQFFEQENNWGPGDGSAAPVPAPMMMNGGGDDAGAGSNSDASPDPGNDASPDPGNDAGPGPADACNGVADGTYCGGDGVSGDSSTLFTCAGGIMSSSQVCSNGCAANGDQDGLDECN